METKGKTKEKLIKELEKLTKNEHCFHLLAENAKDMIYRMSIPNAVYEYVSPASLEIFGYKPEEFYKSPVLIEKIIHPDWTEYFQIEWQNLLNGIIRPFYEYKIIHKSGKTKWMNQHSVLIKDENGKPIAIEGVVRDITNQKETEYELIKAKEKAEESEQNLRKINETLLRSNQLLEESQSIGKLGGWELDVLTNNLYWSAETYRIHDTSPDEFNPTVDAGVGYFLHESKQIITEALELAITKGIGYDLFLETYTTKGRKIDVRTTCQVTMDGGKPIKLTGIFQDITEQKKVSNLLIAAKEKAEESEQMLLGITSNVPGVVFQLRVKPDGNTYFKYISERATELFELSNNQNSPQWDLGAQIPTEDKEEFMNSVFKSIKEKKPWNYEGKIITGSGKIKWFQGKSIPSNIGEELVFNGIMEDITDRKNTEKEIIAAKEKAEKSEKAYKDVVETTADLITVVDNNGEFLFINHASKYFYGKPPEECVGKLAFNFIHPDDKESTQNEFAKWLKSSECNFIYENRIIKGDGVILNLSWNIHIERFENKIVTITSIGRDITKQKQIEQQLIKAKEEAEESRKLLNETGKIGKVGGWIFNIDTLKQIWTEETYLIHEVDFNFDPNIESGINFYAPTSKPIIENAVKRAIEFGEPYNLELEIITAKNNIRNVHAIGRADLENRSVYGFFQDISEQKQIEKQLIKEKEKAEESEQKLLVAQELSHVGSWEYVIETDTVYWSKELYNIFEHPYDLPAPKYFEQQPYYTDKSFALLDKAVQDCIQHEISYEIELDIYTSTGSIKHIISKGNVKKDKNNKIIGSFGTAQDITLQKKLELELVKAKERAEESDRLKSAFLANMSHEIRTPMNGILGFAELLKEPNLTGEQQKEFISIIEKSGKRMLNIINDIVDISKIESGQMKLVIKDSNINNQLEYIYAFFKAEAETKGIQLILKNSLPATHAIVQTDREKVFAILTNLVKNSMKFTDLGSIEFGCNLNGMFIEFFVKDTGIGIPKNRQIAVFERFIQSDVEDSRAFQGAGLGLAITKSYVEMLGGKIWLESEEGKGSTFYFTIPYNTKPSEENNTEDIIISDSESEQIRKLKILIAEDDDTSKLLISNLVDDYSKEILYANDGVEAIETCRNNPDLDLVLMDIKMPKINGYGATKQIRKFNKDVIIISQTAFGLVRHKKESLESGCNDYISKPIKKDVLVNLLHKYFKEK